MFRKIWRRYLAAKALQGFCANPAVFAHNPMNGWALVNCSEKLLSQYAYMLADDMIEADAATNKGDQQNA